MKRLRWKNIQQIFDDLILFNECWMDLAKLGQCDELGSAECLRVWALYFHENCPHNQVVDFIRRHARASGHLK
jgi:hypothetical protein